MAKVTSFSGEMGSHKKARYAPDTAIIQPTSNATPSAIIIYDQPLVIIHAMPKQRRNRGFKNSITNRFKNRLSLPFLLGLSAPRTLFSSSFIGLLFSSRRAEAAAPSYSFGKLACLLKLRLKKRHYAKLSDTLAPLYRYFIFRMIM